MSDFILAIVRFLIEWLLIPGILLCELLLAYYIARAETPDDNQRISKAMAFYLGLAIFVLAVVLNLFNHFPFVYRVNAIILGNPVVLIVFGVLIGAALLAIIHFFLETRAISMLTTIMASTSLISLYFYILVEALRGPVLTVAVSVLIGALVYVVFAPDSIKSLKHIGVLSGNPWLFP